MDKIRFLLRVCLVMAILLGVGGMPVTTQAGGLEQPAPAISQVIPETYRLAAENAAFRLYVDPASLGFKVEDRRSGYVWNATLDERLDDDRLNRTWTAFAQSGISIDYLDPQAVDDRASITNAEHTLDVRFVEGGVEADLEFTEPGIAMRVNIKLGRSGVSVEVPFESIQQNNPDYKLGLMYVYPFMGATRGASTPGYMFIPDGAGALIRFAEGTKAQSMFYGRYYGTDLGMISTLPYDPRFLRPFKLSVPVYGMVHGEGEHGFISIVENGASYGQLHVHPAGIITNFNFIYHAFLYNESYFQATNRSGAGVTTLQPQTNAFDVRVQYRFLTHEASDYVGMARSYQKYLADAGILKRMAASDEDISIKLEFLAGEKEKVLFWHRFIPMTTIEQMGTILDGLAINHPEVIYYGWQPLGAASMPPQSLEIERGLGTTNELRALIEDVQADGGNFSLYLDPQAALRGESGYSMRNDLAMSITTNNLLGYNRWKVNHYLNLEALSNRYSRLSREVFSQLGAGLALDGISETVYSDFRENRIVTREDTIAGYQALMQQSSGRTGFYLPNDYMFSFMDAYYDIPVTNSGYIYTSELVPFLQIVFAGYVPVYGPALNFSSDLRADLLRHADYGVYPSFYLTQEATSNILNTPSSWIYTSSIAQWEDEVEESYAWLNALLGPVKGQRVVARETLASGVVATTYENGKQIIVNYNNWQFRLDLLEVGPRDAILREVAP